MLHLISRHKWKAKEQNIQQEKQEQGRACEEEKAFTLTHMSARTATACEDEGWRVERKQDTHTQKDCVRGNLIWRFCQKREAKEACGREEEKVERQMAKRVKQRTSQC